MTTPLQKAAQAVIDRWDSPSWKDQPHTAEYIAELRKALDVEVAQAVEPAAYRSRLDSGSYTYCITPQFFDNAEPLYLHPPQPNYGWLDAVDKEMVCAHLGVANVTDAFDEANAKLLALINWHVAVATDPAVNGGLSLQPQVTTAVPHPLHRNISQHEIDVLNSVQYVLEVALSPTCHTQWLADRAEIIEDVRLLLASKQAQGEKP